MLVIIPFFFAYFGCLSVASSSVCTIQKVEECYDLLNKDQLPKSTVLYYSEEVMTEHCRRYKIFSECMKTIRPYCKDLTNFSILIYQGIDDAFNFACGSGFSDYLHHQSCFKEDDVQFEAKICNDHFTSRLEYLKNNVTDKKYFAARYCQYVNNYIDCVYNLLRSFCGEESAIWHKTFDRKSLLPPMIYIGCAGWSAATTPTPQSDYKDSIWIITLGVAIVVTGFVVAIGLILLVCTRCSGVRCRRRSSLSQSISVDMPPPYSGPFTICRTEAGPQGGGSSSSTSSRSSESISIQEGREDEAKTTVLPPYPPRSTPDLSSSGSIESRKMQDHRSGEIQLTIPGAIRSLSISSSSSTSGRGTVFEDSDETMGAVGGSPFVYPMTDELIGAVGGSPFIRPITPARHFEMPSPSSSILSHLQSSSDDDCASLISHSCDYY